MSLSGKFETPEEMSRKGGFGMGMPLIQLGLLYEWEDRKRDLNVQDGRITGMVTFHNLLCKISLTTR